MYRVLLISFADWDSLMELPALLKNGGCTVDIYCRENSLTLKNSSYADWIEGSEDDAVFTRELIEHVKTNKDKYNWIIPGDDLILRLLNESPISDELFYKMLPLSKIENRELLGSKAGFSNLCTKYDIKTPRYLIYNQSLSTKQICDYMRRPFLIKVDKSEAGIGVYYCENETDLISNLEKVKDKSNLVFQQFIKGYDVNVEVLFKDNKLITYNYSRTTKILGKFGISTQRLFYQHEEIEPYLQYIGESLGLNGFANVVFMYDEVEKTHYLIEVDTRPNTWMYYGKFTGNDFSEGVRRIIKGDLTLGKRTGEQKPMLLCLYKKDVSRCIVEKDIKGLIFWLVNKDERWKYIPFHDKKILAYSNKFIAGFFKDLVRNKIKKTFKV